MLNKYTACVYIWHTPDKCWISFIQKHEPAKTLLSMTLNIFPLQVLVWFCVILFSGVGSLFAVWANSYHLIHHYRSSHQRCSLWKGVLRNFAKFTGKRLRQSLFINKLAGLRPATLLKKRKCFPVNFAKFLRTPFLQNTFGRLLLSVLTKDRQGKQVSLKEARNVIIPS